MQDLPWIILITAYGACMGSFLNVVIYRLPQNQSLLRPPSSCPCCGHRLKFYDNVPVLGWLWLHGRCRHCRAPISLQYPLIEALCALMFAALYWVNYHSGWRPEFMLPGLAATWPMFVIQLVLLSALLAATLIDARFYIIPLILPYSTFALALALLPLAAIWYPKLLYVAPTVDRTGLATGVAGMIGLAVALLLLQLKILPRSFDDPDSPPDQTPEHDAPIVPPSDDALHDWIHHPHIRREILKEVLFLTPPTSAAILGYHWATRIAAPPAQPLHPSWRILGGIFCGFLVGGALIWFTRVLGSLAFKKEAMGLGDVHLLAAVGAVLGWADTVAVFFIAPFFGLAGTLLFLGLQKIRNSRARVIPYGPYLALAALVMIVFRNQLLEFLDILLTASR